MTKSLDATAWSLKRALLDSGDVIATALAAGSRARLEAMLAGGGRDLLDRAKKDGVL